jgi:hypothetical protein
MLEQVVAENTAAIQALVQQLTTLVEALKSANAKRNEYEPAIPTRTPEFKTTSVNRQAAKAAKAAAKVPRGTSPVTPAADSASPSSPAPTAVPEHVYDDVVTAVKRVLEVKGQPAAFAILAQFKTAEGVPVTHGKALQRSDWASVIAACNKALTLI